MKLSLLVAAAAVAALFGLWSSTWPMGYTQDPPRPHPTNSTLTILGQPK